MTREFEADVLTTKHSHCLCCRSVGISVKLTSDRSQKCTKCKGKNGDYYLRKKMLPVWYNDEGIPQYKLPDQLIGLTLSEMMLIQKKAPFVPLTHIKDGTYGLKGHTCSFSQDVNEICTTLPKLPTDVTVIKMLKVISEEIGAEHGKTKEYKVRKNKVLAALSFLKKYNHLYCDIKISPENLDWMKDKEEGYMETNTHRSTRLVGPLEGTINDDLGPAKAQTIGPRTNQDDIQTMGIIADDHQVQVSKNDAKLIDAIDEVRQCNERFHMPKASKDAVDEFDPKIKLFCEAFPWLFPGGIGDMNDRGKEWASKWGRRMLLYEDGRFASDPVFCFFAMNYIIRHRNDSSGRFYITDFNKNAPKTLLELQDKIKAGDTKFVSNLTYYTKKIKGSSPYWAYKRAELYTWLNHHIEVNNGPPNLFITLSCAESYWPDICRLIKERYHIAGLDHSKIAVGSPGYIQVLNDYSIVVQEFFQDRVEKWLEIVGKQTFGIKHYWVRYEFAPGRGQIHAHLLAITTDSKVVNKLAYLERKRGTHDAEQRRSQVLSDWAQKRFGLTASVDKGFDELSVDNHDSPVNYRFTDVKESLGSVRDDIEKMKKFVQVHECSGFCMKAKNKKTDRRTCKTGCGDEANAGKCDTPGFPLSTVPNVLADHRHAKKLLMTRNHPRLNQTSEDLLRSWRANCDVQILIYDSDPDNPALGEIAQVTDYVASYASKGNATLPEQREQTQKLILQ